MKEMKISHDLVARAKASKVQLPKAPKPPTRLIQRLPEIALGFFSIQLSQSTPTLYTISLQATDSAQTHLIKLPLPLLQSEYNFGLEQTGATLQNL